MLSICTIVKNEHKYIEGFINAIRIALKSNDYELIIVDTGSTDDTVEIASKYDNTVYHYEWNGDFSAAKNYAISLATNDLILCLDCDEYIKKIDVNALKTFGKNHSKSLGVIELINHLGVEKGKKTYSEGLSRVFDRRYFRYEGIVHEQLVGKTKEKPTYVSLPIVVDHYGYMGTIEELRAKVIRNNELLFKELKDNPEDPYLYYQIGQSYSVIEDYEEAYNYLGKGLEFDVDPRLDYVTKMVVAYGYSMINTNRLEEALGLLGVYDEFGNDIEYVTMIGLAYLRTEHLEEAYGEFLRADELPLPPATHEEIKNAARYNLGVINEVLGNKKEASEYYAKCVNYDIIH